MADILTDTERAVVESIRMRLSTEQALVYMKDVGYPVARATYFRYKKKLEEKKFERLNHIAKIGFIDQHLERIDGLELIEKKMWVEYNREKDPFKRIQMLKTIAQVQPYISTYYETTKFFVDPKSIEQNWYFQNYHYDIPKKFSEVGFYL
ncbi:MAG: hypothetical protein MRJ93_11580 [Nitrososphaeraceae archaeon]|nr:hypothetical protein [Nitrososphaeraceae archaeon]